MAYLVDHPPARRQYRSPRRQKPSGVVVVHTAESYPDETGPDTGAENVARFIQTRSTPGSYHDLCDSDTIVHLVRYSDEAYHDGTGSNPHSYGVSAATQAARWPSLSSGWTDATVRNMATASARYARWIKTEHGVTIPAERITRAESERRIPGFISHAERDPSRRSDPGARFPWDDFLDYYAAQMRGTTPTPRPEEDDVTPDDIEKIAARTADHVWNRQLRDRVSGLKHPAWSVLEDVNQQTHPDVLGDLIVANGVGYTNPAYPVGDVYRVIRETRRLAEVAAKRAGVSDAEVAALLDEG